MYTLIVQCPLLNSGILVKVAAVVMVCSLSSFPRPQPQCVRMRKTVQRVQCMWRRKTVCVCNGGGGEPPRPLLHLSPKLHLPPLHHQVVGVGLCPAQDLLQDQTRAKQGHKKKWLFLQRFFAKSRPGFWWYCVVLSTCCVTRTAINIS